MTDNEQHFNCSMSEIICLAPNYYPLINCKEQCEDCKKFQYQLANPKKKKPEMIKEMKKNYKAIINKSKL